MSQDVSAPLVRPVILVSFQLMWYESLHLMLPSLSIVISFALVVTSPITEPNLIALAHRELWRRVLACKDTS